MYKTKRTQNSLLSSFYSYLAITYEIATRLSHQNTHDLTPSPNDHNYYSTFRDKNQ